MWIKLLSYEKMMIKTVSTLIVFALFHETNICHPTAQAAISSNLPEDLYSFVATHSAKIALLRGSAWVIKILLQGSKNTEHYVSHFSFVIYTKLGIKVCNQIEGY